MKLIIEGHQVQTSPALKARVEDALDGIFEKYFGDALSAQVLFRKSGPNFTAHLEAHVGKHIHLTSEGSAGDAYSAFDLAATRLAKRLRRHKRKLKDHHKDLDQRQAMTAHAAILMPAEQEPEAGEDAPAIIAETPKLIPTLSVSEAVMHLDLGDAPALLFHNAGHGGLNMIYRRTDGHLGWVDPKPGA